ncbi:hypothetical protein [uncultured Alistipes sp.]|uniref:hypothetical protein n=1 Tax=uncultured Alistipes sp. TaxID=538949 RepID=UPI0025902CBF|nr:hypothetical protein [uncultured Alistipes sp.]
MKYNLLKSIAVIAAFLVGVAINHSCGESMTDDSVPPTMEEMWNIVRSLRTEVSTLKEQVAQLNAEVAALKSTGGGSSGNSDCGEFFVDGLYFSRNGIVSSKYKRGITHDEYSYYDEHGRIIRTENHSNGYSIITTYEYSGKTVTRALSSIYDPSVFPNSENTTTTTINEYY